MTDKSQIWIGLAEVVPLKACSHLEDAKGAFVNVVGWARSEENFRTLVAQVANEMALELLEMDDCEPFSERCSRIDVSDEILQMVTTAREQPNDVVFGTFHRWLKHDA